MTTTVNTHKTYRFELDLDEINALDEVDRLIKDIQRDIGDETTIISQNTGELIETKDLCRIRGVLNAITINDGGVWNEFN